ncbi:MAG: hypothetical protein M3Z08_17025 [Chloroflexota bacterium]|nr:hypothetical protein [Chloroflexota bacterium]
MHENRDFFPEGPDALQAGGSSPSSHIRHYPQSVFSTLVWLRREHEALALAELAEKPLDRAQILCTIAEHLRKRGDGQKQQILPILAQAQACLASLEGQRRNSRIQGHLATELACWQQWLPTQEWAYASNDSWGREWTFGPFFQQKLQAGLWEEALALAHGAGDSGQRWMLRSLSGALAEAHHWEQAEEIARSIKHPGSKVKALSVLARELALASYAERAEALWRQAIEAAFEEGVSPMVFGELSEDLARAQQWDLAALVAHALIFPLPGAKMRARQAGRLLDQQAHDHIDMCWIPVMRSKALATLALETTKAQHGTLAEALWQEAQGVADSCQSTWHHAIALGNLTLSFAEAGLWEHTLDTWGQAEAVWREGQARWQNGREQDGDDSFQPFDDEAEQQRLKMLVPLCRQLVSIQQWRQAWKLCCELEEANMQVTLGRVIAAALDQIQQSEDARLVWQHTSELALASQLWTRDLVKLALALQEAQHYNEADMLWKASVNSVLEADQDDFGSRSTNCGWLALMLAQAQRWEAAELLLKESMKAVALLAEADL